MNGIDYYKKYEPIFGSWYIIREIGHGSFGRVFEIEKDEFGRKYKSALKAISIPSDPNEMKSLMLDESDAMTYYRGLVEDLSKECAIMSELKGNSNIVSYEDHQIIAHEDDIGWDVLIRMELLTTFYDYSLDNEIDEMTVIRLGIDICNALELCEKNKIIHRDIKPDNIFVSSQGSFKLGDFGVARILESTTGASTRVGTKDYTAPEVIKESGKYDQRVDIYSLGIVLYRLLNRNKPPFIDPDLGAITVQEFNLAREMRISGEIPLPAPTDASDGMAKVVLKACAYNPENRYASAINMKQELNALLHESLSMEALSYVEINTGEISFYGENIDEQEKNIKKDRDTIHKEGIKEILELIDEKNREEDYEEDYEIESELNSSYEFETDPDLSDDEIENNDDFYFKTNKKAYRQDYYVNEDEKIDEEDNKKKPPYFDPNSLAVGLLFFICLIAIIVAWFVQGNYNTCILKEDTKIKKEPSEDSETLAIINKGDSIDYYGKEGDWVKVKYDGEIAYIKYIFVYLK